MMIILLVCIVVLVFLFMRKDPQSPFYRYTKRFLSTDTRGEIGEDRVAYMLKSFNQEGYVINNVILKWHNIYTQVDHILFLRSGIYVIETKNISGRVYGKDRDKYWTQVLAYGKEKHKVYSPVFQNDTHIKVLQHILGDDKLFFPIVIFAQGNIDYIQSRYVYTVSQAKRAIRDRNGIEEYSQNEVQEMYNKINFFKENPPISEEEYIYRVQSRH